MDQKFQLAKVKTRGKSPFEVYNVVFDAKGLGASYAMNMHEATWEIVKHSMNEKKEEITRLKKIIVVLESILNLEL